MTEIRPTPSFTLPATTPVAARSELENRAYDVAEKFESQFVSLMMGFMFESLPTDGPFGGGAGEAAFRPMLVDEYGKIITKAGGIGITDVIAREIIRMQSGEVAPLPGSTAAAAAAAADGSNASPAPLRGPEPPSYTLPSSTDLTPFKGSLP